ncbi:uncharacterized protein LOC133925732 isoform X2 [Phragmites australis]|uniref:uncharacterized protein LOC133925732 isoform X2 n=1 Tax=Phragmites australis TaxID=29695 RepID=UPI002D770E30|nr:uncharacterized protein LOC133925732 isoform X2 [Phragmites australis]
MELQEEIGAKPNPRADESVVEASASEESDISEDDYSDLRRSNVLGWLSDLEEDDDGFTDIPPYSIVAYPDLLERGWGWERLVPYSCHSVQWSEYKTYLEGYYSHNAGQVAALCAQHKPEPIGQGVAAEYNVLHAAANLCLEIEDKFLRSCLDDITFEDIKLSHDIKNHARRMIKSEVKSSVAAAGLVCITKEAELMCMLVKCPFEATKMLTLSNKIRRSALNLMLYKGTESDAVAATAAMVGITKEAKNLCDLLSQDDQDIYLGYIPCNTIRHHAAIVLTMLEKEFARETAGGTLTSDKSEKPIGASAVRYLSCEESDSMENSKKDVNEHCVKDNNTKGKKRRNKNSNKRAEKKLKRKLKKEKRKLEERKLEKRRLKKERRRLKKNGNEAKLDNYLEGKASADI